MESTRGHWLQKLEDPSAAPEEFDHAFAEKRETSPPIFVFRMTSLCSSWKRSSPCFQHVPKVVVLTQPSQSIHNSREA